MRQLRCFRGFTLLELMLALALAMLVYGLVIFVTINVSNTVRTSERKVSAKISVINAAEQLRWQLRCLYNRQAEGTNKPSASVSGIRPATLTGVSLYGKRSGQSGRDFLLFKTSYFPNHTILDQLSKKSRLNNGKIVSAASGSPAQSKDFLTSQAYGGGTAEVGFRILEDQNNLLGSSGVSGALPGAVDGGQGFMPGSQSKCFLAYRQYPWVDRLGLHDENDDTNAPWTVLCSDIVAMNAEYSSDSETWQQEWTASDPPVWVRISLTTRSGAEPLVITASPGVVSNRW